ncbi:carboxylesterase/lipase family protein [Streptomyces sp. NPDC087300]|uniref:carboxylesterase/lipase family protein n=1 Tax=Streptomyces sp. NPDC087300 TaxID=3365780 RepID=UPI0037FD8C85
MSARTTDEGSGSGRPEPTVPTAPVARPTTPAPVTALTAYGEVGGERLGERGALRFLGVPYAADPVGDLRFRPPARPAAWSGVRDCVTASPAPPQGPDALLEDVVGYERIVTDEAGCLTVNVWTPATTGRRPVMVWVHGGGYVQGRGLQVWTDGARLAERHDVVVVSFNYRLGALGWLDVAHLLGADYAQSANLGLQDQIAALAWVRDNIGHFGGDSGSVTVFGESAGGGSVAMLLGAPAARPLFHRAILQSAPATATRTRAEAAEVADAFAAVLCETTGSADLSVLTASAGQLLAAQQELMSRNPVDMLPFAPVVDGSVLPLPPVQALRNGACAHIPLIAGTNEHEGRLFTGLGPEVAPEAFEAALASAFPDRERAARARALYEAYEGPAAAAPTASLAALLTDLLFRSQTDALLDAQAAGGGTVWSYLFREPTPALGGGLGAAHTLDIPYAFDTLDGPGLRSWLGDAPPQELADAMSGAWVHFARHGTPVAASLPRWPRFDPEGRPTMILGGPEGSRVARDPLGDRRELWQEGRER